MSSLVAELNDEWQRIHDERAECVEGWSARHPSLTGCRTLSEVLLRIPSQPDDALLALLTECAQGDRLAGRVIVQTMLGKLVLMARNTPPARVDDFVAALWIRIATYPLAARPQRVAANLALDTLKAVRRECADPPVPPHPAAPALTPPHLTPSEALSAGEVIALGRALGLISERTGAVMHGVYVDGLSGKQAAIRYGITPEMVRYRCSDGTRRLARRSRDLLAA